MIEAQLVAHHGCCLPVYFEDLAVPNDSYPPMLEPYMGREEGRDVILCSMIALGYSPPLEVSVRNGLM